MAMQRINSTVLVSLIACLFPAAALAQSGSLQTNQQQGMFSTAAVGIIGNTSSGTSDVLVRSAGAVSTAPEPWSAARFGAAALNHPDYSMAELCVGFNLLPHTGAGATTLGFSGISTGGDVCPPILQDGTVVPGSSWYFLSITVGGMPSAHQYGVSGSVLSTLAKPEQAILSYYVEGSTGIAASLVDATLLEQSGTDLGYSANALDTVTGIDWAMGAISVAPNSARTGSFAPVRTRLYFSLTQAWLVTHDGFAVSDPSMPGNWLPLDAHTVYVMDWQASLTWGQPRIAFTTEELFGPGEHSGKEIDALSVFFPNDPWTSGGIARVVFSTTPTSLSPNQIMGYDRSTMNPAYPTLQGTAQPLKTSSSVLVSDKLGLKPGVGAIEVDNVTGTCGTDPEGDLNGTFGTPLADFDPSDTGRLGLSVYRSISADYDGGPLADRVALHVTGVKNPSGDSAYVHYQIGLPDTGSPTYPAPAAWSSLAVVEVPPGESTAYVSFPGDYPLDQQVCIMATALEPGTWQVLQTSWISVIEY